MNQPEEKDRIDALLREQSSYLDDNGFTQRVIAALPRRRRAWLRPSLLLGASAIGAVLAVQWLPWGDLLLLNPAALLLLNPQVLLPWIVMFSVVAAIGWAISAAVQCDD